MDAVNPADNYSPLSLKTWVKHDEHAKTEHLSWETFFCDVEDWQEADHEWDNEAIDDLYKVELPKWLPDENLQHCYVVKDSKLMDRENWWLHLFTEFAFYTKWSKLLALDAIAECLPLETQKVVVETRGEAETEPREKLKAANAILYISFECGNDPITGNVANYRAIVRKTMDGKQGHMRLEVRCWSI
ncbi:PREDICTED: UPF0725 protein At4g29550-like [Camelina sativa]|uniref:UPF0725 protein At4g29550-like n=1 Tax=Camelina sativa TaxID=90675 RepID=A0ABM0U6Q6_CAMSA|nr:PREDICTED: UPF0725 protein At4g29550-like [Camelina sativa]